MSFLDHFRRKSSVPDEPPTRHVENRERAATKSAEPASGAPTPAPPTAREHAAAAHVEEHGRVAEENEKQNIVGGSQNSATAETPPPPEEQARIRFSVGDFLHRIPHHLLKHGPHDITFEVCFDAADVGDRVAQGQTTIPLFEVYKRAPHIFRKEIQESDHIEIRFPWQRLMSFIKPENGGAHTRGGSSAAAGALAARVRSRTAERVSPLPPPPSPGESASFAETARAAKLKQLRQPASWAAKPKPPHSPAPSTATEPAAPAPAPPAAESVTTKSTTPVPAVAPAESAGSAAASTHPALSSGAVEPPREPALAETTPKAAPAAQPLLDLGLAPEPAVVSSAAPERPERARDPALETVEVALLKAEHARQMNALARERDALGAQRAQLQNELELFRQAAAEVRARLDEQTSAMAERQAEIARAENTRAELQKQMDDRQSHVAALEAEIARLNAGNEDALKTVLQERDALLQQKAYLTEQLSKVRLARPGAAMAVSPNENTSGDSAVRGMQGVERSKREARQIEELQRRITAFESSQKEAAHELTREREARIKVERALAAAERARAEATALVENTRAESRRDLETGLRKRDSELARTQQELQEQLDAAIRANEQTKAEKHQLLTQLNELQSTAIPERDQLRARVAELEQSGHSAAPAAAGVGDWESRAVASLESDVEGYRARIKALLQERDAWLQERTQLAAQSSTPATASLSGAVTNSIVEQLTMAQEKLRADLETVTDERDRLAAQLRKIEQQGTTSESVDRDGRIDELGKELISLRQTSEAARQHFDTQMRVAIEERDAARQQLAELERAHATRDASSARALNELRARLTAQEKTIAELRASATAEKESGGAVNEAAVRQIEETARERAKEFEKQIAALRDENIVLTARVKNLEATSEQERKNFARQTEEIAHRNHLLEDQLKTLSTESQRAVDEMRRQRDRLEAEKEAARSAFVTAEAAHTAQKASLAREHEAAIKRRDEALAALEEASARAQEAAEALTHEHMRREAAEAEAKERLERELAQHQHERDLLQRQRDELRSRLSRIVSEQSDLLEQIDNPSWSTKPVENRPRTTTDRKEEEDVKVIEITGAEVVNATDTDANIHLPQVRPVQTRPPEVRTG
jgi:chromosome segregation ATPase